MEVIMKTLIVHLLLLCAVIYSAPLKLAAEDYPPYEYLEGGVAKGMDVEIINTIVKKANIPTEIIFLPWSRCLVAINEYNESGIFSILKTPEREKQYNYSSLPLYSTKVRIYANNKFTKTITKTYELEGMNVGAGRGNLYGDAFDKNPKIEKDLATDGNMLINKLIAGRYDLIIAAEEVGSYYIKKFPMANLRMLPVEVSSASYYIAFNKNSLNYFKFDDTMKELEKSGELKKIRDKYKTAP
jgi:polar amino acid transport system substrate-binding protein